MIIGLLFSTIQASDLGRSSLPVATTAEKGHLGNIEAKGQGDLSENPRRFPHFFLDTKIPSCYEAPHLMMGSYYLNKGGLSNAKRNIACDLCSCHRFGFFTSGLGRREDHQNRHQRPDHRRYPKGG